MRIIESSQGIANEAPPWPRCSVTIGNFDGCHRGHQKLIGRAKAFAQECGAASLALTFEPHPRAFFAPHDPEVRLFTPAQKLRAFAEAGLDAVFVQEFDKAYSQTSPEAFFEEQLRKDLRAAAVVVGDNFQFGRRRLGNAAMLEELCKAADIAVSIESPEPFEGESVSSSRIRQALAIQGDAAAAQAMLGRPFALEGRIAEGRRLGRTIQVPTANLAPEAQLVPAHGVYAGFVWLGVDAVGDAPLLSLPKDGIPAVFNIGSRPTVNQDATVVSIEAHLLHGAYGPDSLYGVKACYYFCHRLRGERKFGSLDELKAQIGQDVAQAKALLTNA